MTHPLPISDSAHVLLYLLDARTEDPLGKALYDRQLFRAIRSFLESIKDGNGEIDSSGKNRSFESKSEVVEKDLITDLSERLKKLEERFDSLPEFKIRKAYVTRDEHGNLTAAQEIAMKVNGIWHRLDTGRVLSQSTTRPNFVSEDGQGS